MLPTPANTAATRGESSYGNAKMGGMFTHTLVDALSRDLTEYDGDHNGAVSWQEFFLRVKEKTTQLEKRQVPESHYLNELRASEYRIKLTNKTDMALKVRFRYLRNYETEQLNPANIHKEWLSFDLPAQSELVVMDGDDPVLAYAYQLIAAPQNDGRPWVHSSNPNLRDQNRAVPRPVNMGISYNAGPSGDNIRTCVRAFEP